MREESADLRLIAFGLGTFHTVLLVIVLVVPLYLTVDLGEALEGLNTALGLGIFAVLWAISVYCTYRGLRDGGVQPVGHVPVRDLLSSGSIWGTWNGMLFFWSLLAGGLVLLLGSVIGGGDSVAVIPVVAIAGFGIGTVFAAPIGAFVGVVFTTIDIGLLSIAQRMAGVGPQR